MMIKMTDMMACQISASLSNQHGFGYGRKIANQEGLSAPVFCTIPEHDEWEAENPQPTSLWTNRDCLTNEQHESVEGDNENYALGASFGWVSPVDEHQGNAELQEEWEADYAEAMAEDQANAESEDWESDWAAEAMAAQYDDDPSPYAGTYSEE